MSARPVRRRGTPAAAVLAGGISRHGAACRCPSCNDERPALVAHNVIDHAAHDCVTGRVQHDLARWVIASPMQPTAVKCQLLGVPADATYHSGYVVAGKQHWIYTAPRPPLRPTCPTCERCAPTPHSPTCSCEHCRADLATCSLVTFAAAVRDAAEHVGADAGERFGARKVFVAAVHAELIRTGHQAGSLDAFKVRLLLANRAGHMELARADLVGAMPREAVAASEICDRGSEFHFVLDAAAREPWECAS